MASFLEYYVDFQKKHFILKLPNHLFIYGECFCRFCFILATTFENLSCLVKENETFGCISCLSNNSGLQPSETFPLPRLFTILNGMLCFNCLLSLVLMMLFAPGHMWYSAQGWHSPWDCGETLRSESGRSAV